MSLKGAGIWVRTPSPEAGAFWRLAQVKLTCPWCHQEVLGLRCTLPGGFVPTAAGVHSGKAQSWRAQNVSFYIRPQPSETSNFNSLFLGSKHHPHSLGLWGVGVGGSGCLPSQGSGMWGYAHTAGTNGDVAIPDPLLEEQFVNLVSLQ